MHIWPDGSRHTMSPEEYRAHIVAVVDQAPPLTAEQCAVLTRVMLPPGWSFVPPAPAGDDTP